MRSFASSLAFFLAFTLQAATPKLVPPPPDSAHQQQMLENIKQFAVAHLDRQTNLSCKQVAFGGSTRTITVELANVSPTQRGTASSIDTAGLIQEVFAVSSATQFEWDHWGTIAGKKLAAYRYSYQMNGKTHSGFIFADEDTGAISRMTFRGADAPAHLFCSAQTR